ncbi:MAG: TetR/AcrR family transcriptional regulator, partial [Deltaproteobacteria bacterium]
LSTFNQIDKRKQKRIISAALTEFANNGYHGTSINNIAKKVGISKASIFTYFSDKESLFLYVFQHCLEMVKDYLTQVMEETKEDDFFTQIEKSLLAGVKFIKQNPRVFRLYLRIHFDQGPKSRRTAIKSIRRYSVKYLTGLMENAKNRGELSKKLDVSKAAFVLDSVLERFLQAYGVEYLDAGLGIFKADENQVGSWAKAVVKMLRQGMEGA